jgi:hypothetical protein
MTYTAMQEGSLLIAKEESKRLKNIQKVNK